MKILNSIKDVKKKIGEKEEVVWVFMITNTFTTTEKIVHKDKITKSYDKNKKLVVEILDFEKLWKDYSDYKGKRIENEVSRLTEDTITGYLSPVSEYIDFVLYRDVDKQFEELKGIENTMKALKSVFVLDNSDLWSQENIHMTYLYTSIIKFYKDVYKINIVENSNSWRCGIRGEYYGMILGAFKVHYNNVDPEHKKGKHFKLDISNGKYDHLTEEAKEKLDKILNTIDDQYEKNPSKSAFKSNLKNQLIRLGMDINGIFMFMEDVILIEILVDFTKEDYEHETPMGSTRYRCILRSIE